MLATDSSFNNTAFLDAVRAAESNLASLAWRDAMHALATALRPIGGVVDEDDEGMRDASDDELLLWAADLQDRVGIDVDHLHTCLRAYMRLRAGAV